MVEMIYKSERESEVLKEGYKNGIKFVIMSLGTHPTAYIGVEKNHPLAGHNYDDLPIDCHGGLTYSNEGEGEYLPEGYWWYGWDYAHLGDYTGYYSGDGNEKKWTVKEIENEIRDVTHKFSQLKKLVENV